MKWRHKCALVLLILTSCEPSPVSKSKRVGPIELPPDEWIDRPYLYGTPNYLQFDDMDKLRAYCLSYSPTDYRTTRNAVACYVPQWNVVVTPTEKAWPYPKEIEAMRTHEEAHAKGWSHYEDGIVDWRARMGLK